VGESSALSLSFHFHGTVVKKHWVPKAKSYLGGEKEEAFVNGLS